MVFSQGCVRYQTRQKQLMSSDAASIANWLFTELLPVWAATADGERGGFAERLDLQGAPDPDAAKRLRVQARQIYVFSHAGLTDPDMARAARWRSLAADGFAFMRRHYWRGSAHGWARAVRPDGRPFDDDVESYDIAFVLFACGWHYLCNRDRNALTAAGDSLQFLDNYMAAQNGGYVSGIRDGICDARAPLAQNPHMHLLEALLVLYRATGEMGFRHRAQQIFTLFRDSFFDPATKSLGEAFAPDWHPLPGEEGARVEPGHHFEWHWLLHDYATQIGAPEAREFARALFDFAQAHGVSAQSGLCFDAVDRQGRPVAQSHRLWPQTERLKALVAEAERGVTPGRRMAAEREILPLAQRIRQNYFTPGPGLWVDQLDAQLRPQSQFIPATSLYHIFLAYSEVLRFYTENSSS